MKPVTTKNREVFAIDPTEGDIPNLGVAKVRNPEDDSDWKTLEWELRSFVCEGEYERGLERILDQFVSHLSQDEQPAVWVSGFFGSGKSHLMRVLEYLWRDYKLPSGSSARDLATLSADINAHLVELSGAATRSGGLWSAAGTLGSGASGSVRLAFLGVVFDAAGLPQQYAPARLAIYLKNNGLYDKVLNTIEGAGKEFRNELRNLYVSPVLAQALIESGATFGETASEVSTALQHQFPTVHDISNDEMLETFEEVLKLQSSSDGKLPLTLIVLDEMQQYIGDDSAKALNVQDLVEGCSSRFGSQVLVVATGQAALTANPTLQKLIDRFAVSVSLSDTDVETVVRKVVLRKKPDSVAAIEQALEQVSGEIDRHLGGTKLEPKADDKNTQVSDYPLLPTRRRFWERALRAIDKAGKAGVLRTQLKIVHEAVRSVADEPLGTVIGADFVFSSESASMLSSGVLLKEIDELIRQLDDGSDEGVLKSRACALIFLISQLPQEGFDSGVRATAAIIADLLVEDLENDGSKLRSQIPNLLTELVEQGRVVKVGEEFRLQTEEGAEWTKEFNQRQSAIRDDAVRISQLRHDRLSSSIDSEFAGLKITQGESKTPRKFSYHWGDEEPSPDGTSIPIWIRDEWDVSESQVKTAASKAGPENPTVFVLLPKIDVETIRDTIAKHTAAQEVISQRPEPQTAEGRQAKLGMQSRVTEGETRLSELFSAVLSAGRVFQGGGNEISAGSLRAAVELAGDHSLKRMFPKFAAADNPKWSKVKDKARDGAPDSLTNVDWTGEVPDNPVCKEVLERTSGAGTKGSDIQRQLNEPPYGWPKDATEGALLALLANGNIRAERDGQKIASAKHVPSSQIGNTTFYKEDEPPNVTEKLAVRGLLNQAKIPYEDNQEAAALSGLLARLEDLAAGSGGVAPLPEPPGTAHLDELKALAGNQQFRAIAAAAEQLRLDLTDWGIKRDQKTKRESAWSTLNQLLGHAEGVVEAEDVRTQCNAIVQSRLLLDDPDPISPLIEEISKILRSKYTSSIGDVRSAYESAIERVRSDEDWVKLKDGQQTQVLGDSRLSLPAEMDVSSKELLLAALNAQPLKSLHELIDALPAKEQKARTKIAEIINPEPTISKVNAPSATLKTADEVDAYLAGLRTSIMQHIDAGEIVVT